MQAGLVNTYQHPASNRSWIAWGLSLLLFAGYVLLYFGGNPHRGFAADPVEDWARALGLDGKWTLYGIVYTLAMIAGGLFVLRRHGNSPYQRVRTITVVAVALIVVILGLLPSGIVETAQRFF